MEPEDCAQEGEDFGYALGLLGDYMFADDLEVAPNTTFYVDTIVTYYLIDGDMTLDGIDFEIFTDNAGIPDSTLDDYEADIVYGTVLPGFFNGRDLGIIQITFETPIALEGGSEGDNYWFGFMAPNGGGAGLLTSDVQEYGSEFHINAQGEWVAGSEAYDFEDETFDLAIDFYGTCDETETTSVTQEKIVEINVYPNPAKDFIYIKADGQENTISIVSTTGVEVLNEIFSGDKSLNLDNLTNGVYFYTIRDNNKEVIKASKLIIQK